MIIKLFLIIPTAVMVYTTSVRCRLNLASSRPPSSCLPRSLLGLLAINRCPVCSVGIPSLLSSCLIRLLLQTGGRRLTLTDPTFDPKQDPRFRLRLLLVALHATRCTPCPPPLPGCGCWVCRLAASLFAMRISIVGQMLVAHRCLAI